MKKPIVFILVMPFIIGCGASFQNTYLKAIDTSSPASKDKVLVVKRGEQADFDSRPHQVLGKIYVQKRGATIFSKPNENSMFKLLVEKAASVGTDALIDAHSSLYFGKDPNKIKRWASALAIKFVSDNTLVVPADFVICIPPVRNMDTDDPEKIAEDDLNIREVAQNSLEKLGYYAMTSEVQITPEEVMAANPDELANLGSKDASLILCLTLESYGGVNGGLVGSKKSTLRAVLISKDTRQQVWTNTDSGSYTTLGLVPTLIGGHRKKSMWKATREVLKALVPYSGEQRTPHFGQ